MEKLEYVKPSAEVVRFENEDIITTSGNCGVIFDNPGGCEELSAAWGGPPSEW